MSLFDDLIDTSKEKQVPRNIVAKDLATLIRGMSFTTEELHALYEAIRGKLISKSCARCQLLKVVGFEGSVVDWVGFGKSFLCVACQYILKEKGQLEL